MSLNMNRFSMDIYDGAGKDVLNLLIRVVAPSISFLHGKTCNEDMLSRDKNMVTRIREMIRLFSRTYYGIYGINFTDMCKKPRFILNKENQVVHVAGTPNSLVFDRYTFKNLHDYVTIMKEKCASRGVDNIVIRVLRAFRDRDERVINSVHPVRVAMYVWAAVYLEWEASHFQVGKDWWISFVTMSFCDSINIKEIRLFQCFRRPDLGISSDDDIAAVIHQSMKEELSVEPNPDPESDVTRSDDERAEDESHNDEPVEHICGEVCKFYHAEADEDDVGANDEFTGDAVGARYPDLEAHTIRWADDVFNRV
uniref:Uncharacterized protein n=1 Tax=Panagrolaimus superbus TaxID=310955 RepID=A0A914YD91_9BILA